MGKIIDYIKGTFVGAWLRKWIVRKAFDIVEDDYINKIENPIFKDLASDNIGRAEAAVKILVDNDPDNAAQYREYWEKYRKDILCDTLESAQLTADTFIEDEIVRIEITKAINEAYIASGCDDR